LVEYRADIGAYAFTVDNDTHWIEPADFTDLEAPFEIFGAGGAAVKASSTPNLDVVHFDGAVDGVALHPFGTIWSWPDAQTGGCADGNIEFCFFGIKHSTSGVNAEVTIRNTFLFNGYADLGMTFQNCSGKSCFNSGIFYAENSSRNKVQSPVSGLFLKANYFYGAGNYYNGMVFDADGTNNYQGIFNAAAPISLGYFALKGAAGKGFFVTNCSSLTVSGNVDIRDEPDNFMWLEKQSFVEFNAGAYTGDTSSTPIVLDKAAQGHSVEARLNGNVGNATSAGDEIKVGANAVATFASLPASDVGATVPEFCSAD
jgi:hypothetical protein